MQNSLQGLLQYLLYQILNQCPELIQRVCATRWNRFTEFNPSIEDWSEEELRDCLDRLLSRNIISTKFCFFLDGLDECEADGYHTLLVRYLKRLADFSSVKICVTSREWTVFEKWFHLRAVDGMLRVQEHTQGDIEAFVKDVLREDDLFSAEVMTDERYNSLADDIVREADGVFLWVRFAVKSVLTGIENGNEFKVLQQRLSFVAHNLNQFCRRMLDSVEEVHRQESAKTILFALHSAQPQPLAAYCFLKDELDSQNYYLNINHSPDENSIEKQRKRIKYLYPDILEIQDNKEPTPAPLSLGPTVGVLHGTVRDFLRDGDNHRLLQQRAGGDTHSPLPLKVTFISLCKSTLALVKALDLRDGVEHHVDAIFSLVDEFMHSARDVDFYAREDHSADELATASDLLGALDATIVKYAAVDFGPHWSNIRSPPSGLFYGENDENTFLGMTVQARLRFYVRHKLDAEPSQLRSKRGRPLLDYALRPKIVTPIDLPRLKEFVDLEMVSLLLERGANSNQAVRIYGNTTVWGLFLLSCLDFPGRVNGETREQWAKAVELLAKHGADRTLKIKIQGTIGQREHTIVGAVILDAHEILQRLFPDKHEYLFSLLSRPKLWCMYETLGWTHENSLDSTPRDRSDYCLPRWILH